MPDFIPASFPALVLAHFLALLSPGPDFFLIIGHAIRHRLQGTVFICIGIALGNAIYIVIAITGWSLLKHSPFLYRSLEVAGAGYLLWLGYMLIRSSRQSTKIAAGDQTRLQPVRQFLVGLCSALLNPKNAVFYLTLMTVIVGPEATLAQQVFAGGWMTLLVLVWDMGLAAAIGFPRVQQVLEKRIPLIEKTAGIVLILLAFLFLLAPATT